MIRSRFLRGVYVVGGLLVALLPLLAAWDRGDPIDGDVAGVIVALAPLAVALLAYGVPSPPEPGAPVEAIRATRTFDGRPVAGTLLPLPRPRRIARVVYRLGWFAFFVLLTIVLVRDGYHAYGIVCGVAAALLAPGLVLAVRGAVDPGRSGVFLAPEGLALRGSRRLVPWDELERAAVLTTDYRGILNHALLLHRTEGSRRRGPEPALPACAEDLVELIETLRRDAAGRAALAQGRLPPRFATELSGLT